MKRLSSLFIVTIANLTLLLNTGTVMASAKDDVCNGVGLAGGSCGGTGSGSITDLVASVIGIVSWIVGIAAVVMIMVGGFKYITSQGDSNSINSAKNTVLYAIIGLVVALFAQLIVRFVINKV